MKKVLFLILVFAMVFSVGCSKEWKLVDEVSPLPPGDAVYPYEGTCISATDRSYTGNEVVEIIFTDEEEATVTYYAYLVPQPPPSKAAIFRFDSIYKAEDTYDVVTVGAAIQGVSDLGSYNNPDWKWIESKRIYAMSFTTE